MAASICESVTGITGGESIRIRSNCSDSLLTSEINASLFNNSDGFGIPLIEAGAAKCPVISTNRGPAPELIKDGETGILTPTDNLSELKNAILKILSDEKLEKEMGLKGYQNIVRNYTWETITNITNNVYNEII